MRTLSNYQEAKQSELFDKTGTFFAFSGNQFNEKKNPEHFPYVHCGAGMYCPKKNLDSLLEGLEAIRKEAVKQDTEENGKEAIIRRELANHECFYTMDWTDAIEAVKVYGYTEEDVKEVYEKAFKEIDWDTY